jgi:hypothetical protein
VLAASSGGSGLSADDSCGNAGAVAEKINKVTIVVCVDRGMTGNAGGADNDSVHRSTEDCKLEIEKIKLFLFHG